MKSLIRSFEANCVCKRWDNPEEIKKDWFRIPERETSVTKNVFKKGDKIEFSQIVERAGYFYQPEDLTEKEAIIEAEKWVAEQSTRNLRTYHDGRPDNREAVGKFWHKEDFPDRPAITIEALHAVLGALDIYEHKFYRHVLYQVRKRWIARMRKEDKVQATTLRTFYYWQLPSLYWGEVDHTVRRWIGEYVAPDGGYDSYSGEYNYDPGGLSNSICQVLLAVKRPYLGCYDARLGMFKAEYYLVHPLDAVKVEKFRSPYS